LAAVFFAVVFFAVVFFAVVAVVFFAVVAVVFFAAVVVFFAAVPVVFFAAVDLAAVDVVAVFADVFLAVVFLAAAPVVFLAAVFLAVEPRSAFVAPEAARPDRADAAAAVGCSSATNAAVAVSDCAADLADGTTVTSSPSAVAGRAAGGAVDVLGVTDAAGVGGAVAGTVSSRRWRTPMSRNRNEATLTPIEA
jgi:hypothetical protein